MNEKTNTINANERKTGSIEFELDRIQVTALIEPVII